MIKQILWVIKNNWNRSVFLMDRDGIIKDYLFQPGWITGTNDGDTWSVYNTEFTTDQVHRIVFESDSITIELK